MHLNNILKRQPSAEGKIIVKKKQNEDLIGTDKNALNLLEFEHQVDANVGSTLSDFKILSELGKGSYGTVFKAQSLIDHKEYVIKKINIKHLKPKHQREAQKEVQILRKVQHPNIIRYYSSFMEEDCLYIIMEYAEGGDLQMYIKQFKERNLSIPEQEIWNFAYECCQAVDYLHNNNIIHRDLKTLNVFLTKDKKIKIGDMGVSKIVPSKLALQGTRVGTPLYLAPELVKQQPYDQKIDNWALGCVFYHLAAQEPPFIGDNLISLGYNIVNKSPKPLSSFYSPKLSGFILKFLEKNPLQRPKINDLWEYFPLQRTSAITSSTNNGIRSNPKAESTKNNQDRVEIAESKQNRLFNQLIGSESEEKSGNENIRTEEKQRVATATPKGVESKIVKLEIKDLKRPESAKLSKEAVSRNVTERGRNIEGDSIKKELTEERTKLSRPQSSNINQSTEKKLIKDESTARNPRIEQEPKISSQKAEHPKTNAIPTVGGSPATQKKKGEPIPDDNILSPIQSPSNILQGKNNIIVDKVTRGKPTKLAWTEDNLKNEGQANLNPEKKMEILQKNVETNGNKQNEEGNLKVISKITSGEEFRRNDVPFDDIPIIYEDKTDDEEADFNKEYKPIKKEMVLPRKEKPSTAEKIGGETLGGKSAEECLKESKKKVSQVIMDFEQRLKGKNSEYNKDAQEKKDDKKDEASKIFKIRPFSAQGFRPGTNSKLNQKKLVLGFNDNFIRLSFENFRNVGSNRLSPGKRLEAKIENSKDSNQTNPATEQGQIRPKSAHPTLLSRPVDLSKKEGQQGVLKNSKPAAAFLQSKEINTSNNQNDNIPRANNGMIRNDKPSSISEAVLSRPEVSESHDNNLIQRWNKAILLNVRGYENNYENGYSSHNNLKSIFTSVNSPGECGQVKEHLFPKATQINSSSSKNNIEGPSAVMQGRDAPEDSKAATKSHQNKKQQDPIIISQGFHRFKPAWFEDRIPNKGNRSTERQGIKIEGKSIKIPERKKLTIKDLV